ncbi:MAG: nucleotidyltransferase family protein [Gammaproteobacteria bacterium]|nr:nucleotidyltransferase family protein [Gammaproteobacteria bacterium]
MRAMLLAAGRGERLRPLTDHTPKPLLEVAGKPLIVRQVERLAQAGIKEFVINLAHLGPLIEARLGDGQAWGVRLTYSREPAGALDAAGGLRWALPLLGAQPFVVANTDIWTDFDFATLPVTLTGLAHLVLVPNPAHHPLGDFGLRDTQVCHPGSPAFTYAGIGLFSPALFTSLSAGARAPLAPLLREAIAANAVSGTLFTGRWIDVGTLERWREAEAAAADPAPCEPL